MEMYTKIRALKLEARRKALAEPIEVGRPITIYFQWVKYEIQFTQDRKTLFTLAQMLQAEYHAVNKTGLYSQALKKWLKIRQKTIHGKSSSKSLQKSTTTSWKKRSPPVGTLDPTWTKK